MHATLEPISPDLGVVARGFDLVSDRSDDVRDQLLELVDRHHVVRCRIRRSHWTRMWRWVSGSVSR